MADDGLWEPMDEAAARLKAPLALAFVGDTVWDLMIRQRLLLSGLRAGELHARAVEMANAGAQARAGAAMEAALTEAELGVKRRGENAHARHAAPKNQSPLDYSRATGLEALMGYLYLTGQNQRIRELFDIAASIL